MDKATIEKLRVQADKYVSQAKKQEASGQYGAAASLTRKASTQVRKMAEASLRQADRIRRYANAKKLEEMATRLEQGKPAYASGTQENTSQELIAAADEYKASVDELVYKNSGITWDHIGGMEEVKANLKFTMGMILAEPPEGVELDHATKVLLYGPPGTGKTLLAAACSNMLGATLYNVKASDLLSKYFGESTKLISALYARARSEADTGAAVVFIDEFDSLCGAGESGAERRILSTLLAELDGLADKGSSSRVITIAATNKPWNMDEAILDRFESHILVDLPDEKTRAEILDIHLGRRGHTLHDITVNELAKLTEGYSGRLIERMTKISVFRMTKQMNKDIPKHVDAASIRDYQVRCRRLNREDFEYALKRVPAPGRSATLTQYRKWAQKIGGETA